MSYGISVSKRNNSIEYILKSIFNSPFLLCDQTSLSKKIKDLLPFILYSRYNIELEEIDNFYNEGYIGEDEYNKSKDILTFLYFKTSKEGKKIYKEKKQNNNLNIKVKCIKK